MTRAMRAFVARFAAAADVRPLRGRWYAGRYGGLRFRRDGDVQAAAPWCPLTYTCWVETQNAHPLTSYREAGEDLGLPPDVVAAVSEAADGMSARLDQELRAALFHAAGVVDSKARR